MKYWIGVASADHVSRGQELGIAQIGHGSRGRLAKMQAGDWLVYYAPRRTMSDSQPLQAFTTIARMPDDDLFQAQIGQSAYWRRRAEYIPAVVAPIKPLLDRLSLTSATPNWGYAFRMGLVEISAEDFAVIATAMQASV